jgi:Skp family chaperone for outer membrane proteins
MSNLKLSTFIFFFALLTNSGFSQSKKSQIEYLNFQLDSIQTKLTKEQNESDAQIKQMSSIIEDLKEEIKNLDDNLTKTKQKLILLDEQKFENGKKIILLSDSLQKLNEFVLTLNSKEEENQNQFSWSFSTGGINGPNGANIILRISLLHQGEEIVYFTQMYGIDDEWETPIISGSKIQWEVIDNFYGYEFNPGGIGIISIQYFEGYWDLMDNEKRIVQWERTYHKPQCGEWLEH